MDLLSSRRLGENVDANISKLLREVVSLIKELHPNCTVILFGSYARGDFHEESDLDICILVPALTQRRIDMNVEIRGLIGDLIYSYDMGFDNKLYTYDEFEQEAQYKSTLSYTIKTEGVTLSA